MTVGTRIKLARKSRDNMSRRELSERTGIPYPTLAGIENDDQASSTKLHAIADALGVNTRWLETGKGPRDLSVNETGDDWQDVLGYSQAAALGDGAAPEEWAETHKLKFRTASLRKRGLRPDKLQIYYGSGDSMEPRIRDGDAIMFDTGDKRLVDEGLFVVCLEGHIYAKVMQKIGETWHMVSENRTDKRWRKPVPIKDTDDFEVLGRVCWIGRWEG